jgi:hypothetical protein
MKDIKVQKEFLDDGFGFPLRLFNVPMRKVRGVWTPDLDYNNLTAEVLKALAHKPFRLTGNEVRFIRLHTEMTLTAFGKRFGVSHANVKKWEACGDQATHMQWTTEKDIRMFIALRTLGDKAALDLYRGLVEKRAADTLMPSIDVGRLHHAKLENHCIRSRICRLRATRLSNRYCNATRGPVKS